MTHVVLGKLAPRLPQGVSGHYRKGHTVFEIDTEKARYQGQRIDTYWRRRKFENLLFLDHTHEQLKFIYH